MPNIRVTPVIGLPQFNGWSQVVESPPHSSVRSILSIAIEGVHAGNVGRDIANYFSSQVVQTLEEFHVILEEVITQATENEVRVLCSAGFFSQQSCAYATYNGAILLKRGKKVGTILSSSNQLKLIAGTYTPQDVVVFSTVSGSHFFAEIEQKFEQGFDADTIVTSIVPGLHAQKNSSLSSLAFVSFVERDTTTVVLTDRDAARIDEPEEPNHSDQDVAAVSEVPLSQNKKMGTEEVEIQPTALRTDQLKADGVAKQLSESLEAPLAVGATTKQPTNKKLFLKKIFSSIKAIFKSIVRYALAIAMRIGSGLNLLFSLSKTGLTKVPSLASFFPGKDVYIQSSVHKRQRAIKIIIFTIVLVLIAGVVSFLIISKRAAERERAKETLAPYLEQAEIAQQQVGDDPVAARNQLQSILNELDVLSEEHTDEALFLAELTLQKDRLSAIYENISGLDEVKDLPIFYDLRLVSSDFVASQMARIGDVIYFLDPEQKTLVQLTTSNKKVAKYELPVTAVVGLVDFEDTILLLGEGISSLVFEDNGIAVVQEIPEGDSNRAATLFASYETYVYVVNPEKRNIYRYAQNNDGFSEPIGWVQEVARGLDFKDIASVAIDGDVWLGTKAGQLFKFTRGIVQDFTINGMQTAFESSLLVHTTLDSERLYVLEAQKNRLVILNKNGDFVREITSPSLGSVTDIVVDEAQGKVFAASGSVVFEVVL